MNQRVAHITLDADNTLVVPTPKRLCIRIPLPSALESPVKYTFTMGSAVYQGYLNATGEADIELESNSGDGTFKVWPFGEDNEPFQWQLALGLLPDIQSLQGVQSRLNNLGFDAGPVDGIMGSQTRAALKRFQMDQNITVNGEPDSQAKAALEKAYGS